MIPFQMRANIIVIFSSFLKYISVCFIFSGSHTLSDYGDKDRSHGDTYQSCHWPDTLSNTVSSNLIGSKQCNYTGECYLHKLENTTFYTIWNCNAQDFFQQITIYSENPFFQILYRILRKIVLNEFTSDTPDTADSPRNPMIKMSAIPTKAINSCSRKKA